MRNQLLTIILVLTSICGKAQEVKRTADYTPFLKNEQIEFSAKWINCERPQDGIYAEYILMKIQNLSKQTLVISWYNDIYMNESCTNCDHSLRDRKRTITLQPGQTMEGDCAPGLNVGLRVFSKWLRMANKKELTGLVVSEVSVSPAIQER